MADFIFNIAKGKFGHYAGLPLTNDAFIIVPLEASGVEADATLKDYDDLAALLGGSSNEQTTLGRKSVTSVTPTIDDTNDRLDVDIPDQTWTAGTGNAVGDLLACYDSDTMAGTDSGIIPLSCHDFAVTPDGSDITAQVAAAGLLRAS
jgi:hypothetical protein